MGMDSFESLKAVNRAHEEIGSWLEKVRFRRALFGVSEEDVWKKIEELDALYTLALKAERIRYDALLAHLTGGDQATQLQDHLPENVFYDETNND